MCHCVERWPGQRPRGTRSPEARERRSVWGTAISLRRVRTVDALLLSRRAAAPAKARTLALPDRMASAVEAHRLHADAGRKLDLVLHVVSVYRPVAERAPKA